MEANLRAIGEELQESTEIAPKGIIGFNIMVEPQLAQYVKEAVKAGQISSFPEPDFRFLPEFVEGAKRENSAYCVHCKICHGHLQDVGPQVQADSGSSE